jgi:hypothetical protein
MKRVSTVVLLVCLLFGVAASGCRKKQDDNAAIRAGITDYLRSLNTLNLSSMDMNITKVTINGNQADAQVEFVPKTGAPPGAGMQVSYSLEKRNEQWVVIKRNAVGGGIAHPDPGANPHQQTPPGATHGMPNFQDLLQPSNPGTTPSGTLPPGHPPVDSGKTTPQTQQPKKP